jgi:hypothetical protein
MFVNGMTTSSPASIFIGTERDGLPAVSERGQQASELFEVEHATVQADGPRLVELELGITSLSAASTSPRLKVSTAARTISTFSCDIALAVSRSGGDLAQ